MTTYLSPYLKIANNVLGTGKFSINHHFRFVLYSDIYTKDAQFCGVWLNSYFNGFESTIGNIPKFRSKKNKRFSLIEEAMRFQDEIVVVEYKDIVLMDSIEIWEKLKLLI